MRLIKRYKNRRLYDVAQSRTITQTDLAEMVKDGAEIKVIDNASGKDITLQVLGRLLLQQSSGWGDTVKSKALFREIIIIGGDKSMSILRNTLLASIGAFEITKTKAEKVIDDLIKKGELTHSNRKKAVMELLDKAEKSSVKFREKIAKETGKVQHTFTKAVKDLKLVKQADLQKLEKKMDKLTRAIASLEKKL